MTLRRFRIKAAAYDKVHAWLKKQKVDPLEDEKSPEPLEQKGYSMPSDYLPKIVWAHKSPLSLVKAAHGKEVIFVPEGGIWKRLMHEAQIDGYLREVLLSSSADVPMSRDAGHHIVQQRTVGISRRAFAKFISKQAVLQITRNRLPAQKLPGRPLEGRGYLELDLVEAKGRDIGKFVHHPVKDFYWITLIDRLTGWLIVKQTIKKDVKHGAPKLGAMLRKMARALKTDVKYVRSDSGSEFKSDTQAVFEELGIQHKFVKSGNRIEQANKTFQKIWYRLMRLGRGDLAELDVQAQAIFNNTISSITGRTPLEAVDVHDKVLAEKYGAYHKRKRLAKYKAVKISVGDRVRYILKAVVGKNNKALAYKSYRGKHWSMSVHPVVKLVDNVHQGEKYYVNGTYKFRDELLKVPGVDRLTRARVVQSHRQHKRDYVDSFAGGADLVLGDPEEDQPS